MAGKASWQLPTACLAAFLSHDFQSPQASVIIVPILQMKSRGALAITEPRSPKQEIAKPGADPCSGALGQKPDVELFGTLRQAVFSIADTDHLAH